MADRIINTGKMLLTLDKVFDALIAKLGCTDSSDAALIAHWQYGSNPGFRIQVSRKSDGKSLTKFVSQAGEISL